MQHTSHSQTIASIIAFANDKQQYALLRNMVSNPLRQRFRSTLHQIETGDRFVLDRVSISLLNGLAGQNFHIPSIRLQRLSAKVIEHQVLSRNTEVVEHLLNSLRHRAGTTHVVFNIFGSLVVFQIIIEHDLMDKSHIAAPIVVRFGIRQCDVELEIWKFLFDLFKITFVENLTPRACPIPEGNGSGNL